MDRGTVHCSRVGANVTASIIIVFCLGDFGIDCLFVAQIVALDKLGVKLFVSLILLASVFFFFSISDDEFIMDARDALFGPCFPLRPLTYKIKSIAMNSPCKFIRYHSSMSRLLRNTANL